jgi:hypothetical protein
MNPFNRPKSIIRKPSPLETVISKTRPRMLPPKDPNEEKRHLQQYQAMMKKAVKLDAKKQKEQCRKREERDKKTTNAIHIWENEIIPQWKSKIKDKRTMHLWDQGVPPRCRKRVWKLKIGNESNISKNTFNECLARVPQSVRTPKKKEYKAQPSHQIDTDIPFRRRRTSSLDVLQEDKEQDHTNQLPSPNNSSAEDIQWDTVPENHGENGFDGRTAMDLESYDNYSNVDLPDDDDDTSSQDDEDSLDDKEVEDDDDKVLVDPSTINFLNKAIDEDIIRTLPSLCVFQVCL